MALVLRLPYRSIWAPPMKPTSRKPRWARRKVSVIAGSIWARWAARISLVEMGSQPGFHCGPTMPPSITMVRCGACRRGAGVVEAVTLVGIGAVGDVDERVHREAGDHGAVGLPADLVLGDDLLGADEHGRRGEGDVGVHVRIAVDLAVAETVRPVDVDQ